VFTGGSFGIAVSFPSHHRCRPSPCDRLSRPPSTTAAPPLPHPIGRRWTQPPFRAGSTAKRQSGEGSRVHCCSLDEGGVQLCPCGIAMANPQHFTMASRQTSTRPPRSYPHQPKHNRQDCAPHPAHIRQIWGRQAFKGRRSWFLSVLLSVTLAGPAPSGSADTSRLCQGCSHPYPASPGTGCPQLHRPAATGSAVVVSHLHSNKQHLTAHVDPGLSVVSGCPSFPGPADQYQRCGQAQHPAADHAQFQASALPRRSAHPATTAAHRHPRRQSTRRAAGRRCSRRNRAGGVCW